MFTGLIQSLGRLSSSTTRGNYRLLTIKPEPEFDEMELGESIACNGACLTVTKFDRESFTVEVSQETLARTTLGKFKQGERINLERALQVGARLGGHFVTGHIDQVGRLERTEKIGESLEMEFSFEVENAPLVIEKGSIAINGVSLTVNKCTDRTLTVNIIPHSAEKTNLADLKRGNEVNLEFDMLGKYVLRMMNAKNTKNNLTIDKLIESGW